MWKQNPNLVHPPMGMLAPPSEENLSKARAGNLLFDINLDNNIISQGFENKTLFLYDEFHKANSKKESEILRHVTLVKKFD